MEDVTAKRAALARLKLRIEKEFAADGTVCNIDTLFIVNRTKRDVALEDIYSFNLEKGSTLLFNDFEILFIDKGIFFGSRKHADALATTFDGEVSPTGYRHVLEYCWQNTEDYALTVPLITAAVLNIV